MHLLYGLEAPALLLFTAEGLKKRFPVMAQKTPNVHQFVSSYVLLSQNEQEFRKHLHKFH